MRPIQQPFEFEGGISNEAYQALAAACVEATGIPVDHMASVYIDGRTVVVVEYLTDGNGKRYVEPERADQVNHAATKVTTFRRVPEGQAYAQTPRRGPEEAAPPA